MSALLWLAWAGAALATLALVMTLLNLLLWPRAGRAGQGTRPATSVLVPARDEEATLDALLTSVVSQLGPQDEVIVCDDGSRDRTPEIVAEHRARDARVRLIRGRALPAGWVGKPHACHQLAQAATGDLLVFIDADVALTSDATARISGVLRRHDAQVATLFPHQLAPTAGEQIVLPLLPLTFAAWFPLVAIHRHPDPRLMAVSGQIVAFHRETYEDIGGHASIRREIVDDQAICARAKDHGHRVVFATAHRTASCRMYDGFADLWSGFSKNLYEGLGESLPALVGVFALYGLCFLWPFVRLPAELALTGQASAAALLGVGLNLLIRVAIGLRLRQRWWPILLHPFAVATLLAIAINSMRWSRRGDVRWRGRSYPARSAR